jgi:hypothetical protein
MLDAKGWVMTWTKTASLSSTSAFAMNIFYRICDDTAIRTAKGSYYKKLSYGRRRRNICVTNIA